MNPTDLHLPGLRTRLYPLIRQHVAEQARPIAERLQAWRMMSANGLATTNFYGKLVSYRGVSFEGSPRTVFWTGFFEPFILAAARSSFEWVAKTCRERHLNPGDHLVETRDLLHLLATRTYESMASIDQMLRGAGYPNEVTPVGIAPKINAMTRQINQLLVAFSRESSPTPSRPDPMDDILELKPNVHGFGVNLRALWRWLRRAI
jgi:hypothetical protein